MNDSKVSIKSLVDDIFESNLSDEDILEFILSLSERMSDDCFDTLLIEKLQQSLKS